MRYFLVALMLMLPGCMAPAATGLLGAGVGAGGVVAYEAMDFKKAADAAVPDIYKLGCYGVSTADGAFKAAAPALVAAGKLDADALAKEDAIFKIAQARCANPPDDLIGVGTALLGDASAIYLMMAAK